MRVAQIGNFEPAHSTENELHRALGLIGAVRFPFQENRPGVFVEVAERINEFDMVLWTRTGWSPPVPHDEQHRMLTAAADADVPTVGYHLDRWFGLNREHQVATEPFFRCSVVFTADGGHQPEFAALGVNHHWLPPGVSELECVPGTSRAEFRSELAFVGSWRPGYHAEWTHRPELVRWLRRNYGDRIHFWPQVNQPAIRGDALRDLYASVDVVVGDSCLAGGASRYWSDRVPETIGRGGFLIHPHVEGLADHFTPGVHLVTWHPGDWNGLRHMIEHYLRCPDERAAIAEAGRAHVLEHHTYTVRMRQVVEHLGL